MYSYNKCIDKCYISVALVLNTEMCLKVSRSKAAKKKNKEAELLITPSLLTLWPHLPGGGGRVEKEKKWGRETEDMLT